MTETLDGLGRKLKPEEIVSHFPLRILGPRTPLMAHTSTERAVVGMINGGTVCLGREEAGGGVLFKFLSHFLCEGRDSQWFLCS